MIALAFIPSPSFNGFSLGPLRVNLYGLCIAVGIFLAYWIARRRWEARGYDGNDISEIVIWVVAAGVVGARVYHLFTGYSWDEDGIAGTIRIWEGGLSIWGAVLGGTIAVIVLAAFIPLVLTVTESVGVQAAELSVGLLRTNPSLPAFLRRLRVEGATSLLLGVTSGAIVAVSTLLFSESGERGRVILSLLVSIMAAMMAAAMIGSFVPRLMRRLGADPRLASGPVTLMAVDVVSTLIYLSTATALFARGLAAVNP